MLKTGIADTIQEVCSCNFPFLDLEESEVTCSNNDNTTMTFTSTVVYSTESGDMTASTLIRMFQDRAASTSTVISVGGQTATIVSVCSPSCTPETQPSPTSTPESQVEGPSPTTSIPEPPVERPHPTVAPDTPVEEPHSIITPELPMGEPSLTIAPELSMGQPSLTICTQAIRSEETTNIKCSRGILGRTGYWYHYPHHYSSHQVVSLGIVTINVLNYK